MGAVVESFDEVQASEDGRYVFFLHGAIAEGAEGNPESEKFGIYNFSGIKAALDSSEYILVAERRRKGASVKEESVRLADKVKSLMAAGVPAKQIAVVGFSKGGGIVAAAMSLIDSEDVRYALLAACPRNLNELDWAPMAGRLLSVYERSDAWASSCKVVVDRSPKVKVFDEISLNSGFGHGEFYQPREEWLRPLIAWLAKDD